MDSVAALTPRSELEGDMGDAQVGAQARLMSQAMRNLQDQLVDLIVWLLSINKNENLLCLVV